MSESTVWHVRLTVSVLPEDTARFIGRAVEVQRPGAESYELVENEAHGPRFLGDHWSSLGLDVIAAADRLPAVLPFE